MHCGKELLQLMSAAALLCYPIQGRTERFDAPAIGDVMISGIESYNFTVKQKRSAGYGHVDQGSVFLSALGLEHDALAFRKRLRHPLGFSQPVRRHH